MSLVILNDGVQISPTIVGDNCVYNIEQDGVINSATFDDATNIITLTTTKGLAYTLDLATLAVDENDFITDLSYNPVLQTVTATRSDGATWSFTLTFPDDVRAASLQYDQATDLLNLTLTDGTLLQTTIPTPIELFLAAVDFDEATRTFTATLNDGSTLTTTIADVFLTTFAHDPLTGDVTFTLNDGTIITGNIPLETITTLVNNGDGTYTYTSEDGNTTTIQDVVTTLTDQLDGTYLYTNEAGVDTIINTNDIVTTLVDNGDGTFTYTNEAGATTIINAGSFTDCDGNDIAAGTAILPISQISGLYMPFADSGDGCTPAPVTTCPAIQRMTIAPNGDVYTWNGGAWTLNAEDEAIFLQAERTGPFIPDTTIAASGENVLFSEGNLSLSITNPSDCRDMQFCFTLNGRVGAVASFGEHYTVFISAANGNNMAANFDNQDGRDDSLVGKAWTADEHLSHTWCGVLAPGATATQTFDFAWEVDSREPGAPTSPVAFITFNRFVLYATGHLI